jgi:hypothetical protein
MAKPWVGIRAKREPAKPAFSSMDQNSIRIEGVENNKQRLR